MGDTVTSEINGTDTINYTYDADGNLVSMNLNGTEYYYIKDGMGNIIGLFDSTGAQVVSYTYDTWGKLISITGSLANTVGVKNPYRYHGYRYDTETGLYYLQSRYYNPEWGRLINADAIAGSTGELLGHNVFAYCKNNPVNMYDDDGFRPQLDDGKLQRDYAKYKYEQRQSKINHKKIESAGKALSNAGTVVGSAMDAAGKIVKNYWEFSLPSNEYIGLVRDFPYKSISKVSYLAAVPGFIVSTISIYTDPTTTITQKNQLLVSSVSFTGIGFIAGAVIAGIAPGPGWVFLGGIAASYLISKLQSHVEDKYIRKR